MVFVLIGGILTAVAATTSTTAAAIKMFRANQDASSAANEDNGSSPQGLKVLFLSSDTGGGHRASAESLAKQFQLLYPGSTYDLLDVVESDGVAPYKSLVSYYKHLSAHPSQWKIVYSVSNSRAFEMLADAHLKLMCERAVRRRIKSYNPDVVVSVHPLMTNVPVLSCKKISRETGKHLPMFTVVTDLGSAHCLWFANGVEKMFVGSEQVRQLAMSRGKVPEEKLIMAGLPIRHDFAVQAELLGDRLSPEGKAYQRKVREDLQSPFPDRKTILIMGGGEGVGSLSSIVDRLYVELVLQGIDAVLMVVCGRNDKLKKSLEERDWNEVLQNAKQKKKNGRRLMTFGSISACGGGAVAAGCIESGMVTNSIRRILSTGSLGKKEMPIAMPTEEFIDDFVILSSPEEEEKKCSDTNAIAAADDYDYGNPSSPTKVPQDTADYSLLNINSIEERDSEDADESEVQGATGEVKVVGLGFVTRMAEYMVSADVLVSKAGPGTISEAAALALPVMLTSFLPGQEEGNVDYVIEGGFGAFCSDSDPAGIAEEVCMWLTDDAKMAQLSAAAKAKGSPHAARDIVKVIGDSALNWRRINETGGPSEEVDQASDSSDSA